MARYSKPRQQENNAQQFFLPIAKAVYATAMSLPEPQTSSEPPHNNSPSREPSPTALVLAVSGAVAFAIMGDSLLYAILPLAAGSLALSPRHVGLLLSANRLIRLFSNTWLSALFARFGPYRTFVYSAILGVLTTAAYGLGWGFTVFLIARMGWGISWSGLRQGTFQSIWTGRDTDAGRLMGMMWGVVRGGSAVSAVLGGFLFDHYGYEVTIWSIVGLSALAIPIALVLSWPASASPESKGESSGSAENPHSGGQGEGEELPTSKPNILQSWKVALTDPMQRSVLLVGFFKLLLNSILVATASVFLADNFGSRSGGIPLGLEVGAMTGIVLGTRWFSDLFLGAAMGALADWIGRIRLTIVLVSLLCLGLTAMLWIQSSLSIVALLAVLIISTGVNVVLDAYANQAALVTPQPQLFVGVYATASDLGIRGGPALRVLAGFSGWICPRLRRCRATCSRYRVQSGHPRHPPCQAADSLRARFEPELTHLEYKRHGIHWPRDHSNAAEWLFARKKASRPARLPVAG